MGSDPAADRGLCKVADYLRLYIRPAGWVEVPLNPQALRMRAPQRRLESAGWTEVPPNPQPLWVRALSGDLSPLAGLKSLQTLNLSWCEQLSEFAPLELLLPIFQRLYLFGCNLKDVPSEVCAESRHENVLAEVHAHYEDLKAGRRRDAEIKVLFLGNWGTGKTQLCRRLRGEPFDASVPTTQGMQLSEKTMELEDFPEPVRLNLWDFGGQEIYLPVGLALNAQLGSSRNRGSVFCSPSLAERKCSSPTSIPNRRGFTLQSLGKSGLSASVPLSSQL